MPGKTRFMTYVSYIRSRVDAFRKDESGAITVDWVVLTAAVLGMCIAIFTTLGNGAHEHSERIADEFSTRGIASY